MTNFKYEQELINNNITLIAGVDEAGRGPLAGPVVVASVVLPLNDLIEGINDSKKLSDKKRRELFDVIIKKAIDYKIEIIDEKTIDKINILNATKLGMENAVNTLKIKPEYALIDAVNKLKLNCKYKSIIHGDEVSYLIGAASILAKVTRDNLMIELDKKYPEYNFKQNKGYGTQEAISKLKEFGACDIHRQTFIKNFIDDKKVV